MNTFKDLQTGLETILFSKSLLTKKLQRNYRLSAVEGVCVVRKEGITQFCNPSITKRSQTGHVKVHKKDSQTQREKKTYLPFLYHI